MGGQGSPRHAAAAGSPALAGIRVVDSPILLLVCFHRALREDLSNLHLLAASSVTGPLERETILELRRRYQFLQMVYKYHSAAEDEVIFRALDLRVGNVACTYSLEHGAINNLFDNVFYLLDALLEDDETSLKTCQELSLCTSTIQASICQHMLKEEEQVFPLMMQRFSFKEQALLVWQFMCSVPIILLEDFLPWMISYLSVDEQADILNCIKEIVPKEKLLQEVVISWLGKKSRTSYGTYNAGQKENEASPSNEELSLKEFPKIYSHRKSLTGEKCHHRESIVDPIDGVRLWYSVIRKELKEILDELHEIKRLKIFSSLSLVSSRIMFVADVLIFYSEALEKVIFPVLNGHDDGRVSLSHQRFPEESQIEGLLHGLRDFNAQNGRSLHELVEKLCWQLESFMIGTTQHFEFQESEVFPPIRKNCDHEMQRSLLYSSFLVMPLGLLKCAITWLSAHITEEESKTICFSIRLAGPAYDVAFTSLLHEWFCIGYSGKTSRENFRKDLQEMFKTRSSFVVKQIEEGSGFFPVDLDARPCKRPHPGRVNENITEKANHIEIPNHASCDLWSLASNSSSSKPQNYEKCSTSYSSGINMQIFFSESLKKVSPIPKLHSQEADAGSSTFQESKPIDPIFHFHKALEKDLEYFVLESARMVEKVEVLLEFRPRFHLVQVLYQAHSNAEDEIAFPALEAIGTLQNISGSYSLDHKLEEEHFRSISRVLDEISELNAHLCSGVSSIVGMATLDWRMVRHRELCVKLHSMCKSMQITLGQHIHREEIELWPLFLKHFSEEEQERIVGSIIGRTRAEILQRMIPWLLASLTPSEQHTMMTSWRKVTKNTMFDEWLAEWWEGMKRNDFTAVGEEQNILPSGTEDSLEIVAAYLSKEGFSAQPRENLHDKGLKFLEGNSDGVKTKDSGNVNGVNQVKVLSGNRDSNQFSECTKVKTESNKKKYERTLDVIDRIEKPGQLSLMTKKFKHHEEHLLTMSQEDLEAAVRKVSNDAALDPRKKSYIIQNLLMSRWIITQQKLSHSEEITSTNGGEIPGCTASYQDPLKLTFGCKHYKRNCKLLAACCNRLFTCRYCHDNASDHEMDRKLTTKMMCMKCLHIQPIGPRCAKHSCNSFSMARYFCSICKLFDDEREIYHCPFCNLCRIGKGLGIDYFHCMNCNACMSKSLTVHTCREKCFESNCPICHDDIFTSSIPVKALSCGHLMHSTCFQDYTCTHYTCPICSKSLGDMQVYFGMLDALLAEEKIPQEYCGQTQDILCNDCEKRGVAPFHWLYHKCPHCSSYNTRLL